MSCVHPGLHVSQLEVICCGRGFHLTVQGQNMLPSLILPHIAILIVLFCNAGYWWNSQQQGAWCPLGSSSL